MGVEKEIGKGGKDDGGKITTFSHTCHVLQEKTS
jgi:hypothetical protein